jgi:uncharacterized protein (TIGR02265 family)
VAQVKGLTFADVQAYVRQEGGDESWQRMRDALEPEERAVVESVVGSGWYSLDLHQRVLELMPVALDRDRVQTMRAYAKWAAERHVSRVYRVLFLVINPALMLEKSGEYWHRFYDTGEWKITRDSPTRARGDLVGFAKPNANLCEFLTAYLPALFERIGAKDVKCTHPRCRTRGDTVCSYHLEWR